MGKGAGASGINVSGIKHQPPLKVTVQSDVDTAPVFFLCLFITIFVCAQLNCWIERRRFRDNDYPGNGRNR